MTRRGFSLIEAMTATAMVGVLGAGSIALVTHVTNQGAENRLRALATADAIGAVERTTQLVSVAAAHGGRNRFCELVRAPGGPLAGGDEPAGVCPFLTASNIPVPGSVLRRTVDLVDVTIDGAPALRVVATVTGGDLRRPLVFSTLLPLAGLQ
jgi:hypothetical protein